MSESLIYCITKIVFVSSNLRSKKHMTTCINIIYINTSGSVGNIIYMIQASTPPYPPRRKVMVPHRHRHDNHYDDRHDQHHQVIIDHVGSCQTMLEQARRTPNRPVFINFMTQ